MGTIALAIVGGILGVVIAIALIGGVFLYLLAIAKGFSR